MEPIRERAQLRSASPPPRAWRREINIAILSGCLTACACLIAAEIWTRETKPYLTPDTERAASLEYEVSLFSRNVLPQKPQTVLDPRGQTRLKVNELGYRGRSFALPKPQGLVRIVVLGGSAAFDINADNGEDWPHLMETYLHWAGHGEVEVINAGVPGYATWDVLGRLYSEVWTIEPDYVVVYEAWNDIKYFGWLAPPSHSLARGFRPLPAAKDSGNLMVENPFIYYTGPFDRLLCHSQFYSRLRRRYWWWRLGEIGLEGIIKGPTDRVQDESAFPGTYPTWGPRQYELNLRLIADAARHIGATPVLLTQARLVADSNSPSERTKIHYDYAGLSHSALVRAFADCDRAIRKAAAAEGAELLDLSQVLTGRADLFTDHVHTSASGSEMIARTTSEFFNKMLGQRTN